MVSEITFPPGLSVQTTCEMCLRVRRGSPNPWDLCQLCVQHHRLPFVAVVAGFLFFTLLSFLRSNLKGQCNVSQILPGYEKYKTRGKKLNTDDIDALASVSSSTIICSQILLQCSHSFLATVSFLLLFRDFSCTLMQANINELDQPRDTIRWKRVTPSSFFFWLNRTIFKTENSPI